MAILLKRLTGSQGAGIGVGGTFLILFICLGIWFGIHQTKKSRLRKTQSATSTDATSSPTEKYNTTTATTTNSTDPRYNAGSALEMGTAEGNTHQLSTSDNAHELDSPDRLHEMGDLAPEYGALGHIHVEGDTGAESDVGAEGGEGDMYPQGDHGKYVGEDDKTGEGKRGDLVTRPIAELEGDVAFPDRLVQGEGEVALRQEEGKEGVGKGFVLTD